MGACCNHSCARRTVVALAVGLGLTMALSWAGMFLPHGDHGYGPPAIESLGLVKEPDGARIWQLARGSNPWHTVVRYWHMQISGMSLMIPIEDYEARKFDLNTLPPRFRPESLTDLHMMAWYHESGFPFAALSCSVHWKRQVRNEDIIYRVEGGLQLPRDADFQPRALPLTPVWPGLVGDVLVWSVAWLGLASLIRHHRARRRVRRGNCRNCGYPRTGLPSGSKCPECGQI